MNRIDAEAVKILEKKTDLYLKLLDALEEEKEILKKSELDALWRMNSTKNEIASDIEKIRKETADFLDMEGVKHKLNLKKFNLDEFTVLFKNSEEYGHISNCAEELKIIKLKVYNLQSVNRQFVEEYLGMLGDLVSVIVQCGSNKSYGKSSSYPAKTGGLIVNQEV